MATTVDRAMAKVAAALLPGLLPTPPRSTMITPCTIIMPADFPKPGRADSVKRWDAHKNGKIEHCSPASSQGSNTLSATAASKSPGRADSCERWGMSKKSASSSGSSSSNPGRASSCDKWDGNKRPLSRASSADRWDAHKKIRSTEAADAESRTDEQDIKQRQDDETSTMIKTAARTMDRVVYSGPSYVASPDPIERSSDAGILRLAEAEAGHASLASLLGGTLGVRRSS